MYKGPGNFIRDVTF